MSDGNANSLAWRQTEARILKMRALLDPSRHEKAVRRHLASFPQATLRESDDHRFARIG